MTGCAALLLDCSAKTLHSWSGVGLGKDTVEKTIENIKRKTHVKKRWISARTLIIDEISMLTPELFERLDIMGKTLRKQPLRLFGGLQIVLVGDFCQLPPIYKDISGNSSEARFLFESKLWATGVHTVVILNKIWRQSDPVYQKVLTEVRMGVLSKESEAILRSRMNINWNTETIKPTVLFSNNSDVDKVNDLNMQVLDTELHTFKTRTILDKSKWTDDLMAMPDQKSDLFQFAVNKLDQDAPYSVNLELRIGAQVMLLTNTDMGSGLVNGSRGIIVDFETIRGYPIVKFKNCEPRSIEPYTWYSHEMPHVGRHQIPLRIAYAITIHKSQGASIDSAIVDIGKRIFEYGQAYVALSRVRSLEGLYVFALDLSKIKTHPRVLDFYENLKADKIVIASPASASASASAPTVAWSFENVNESWLPALNGFFATNEGRELEAFISNERKTKKIYPEANSVFHCLSMPITSIKVVILGQDPYHGEGQAIGLAFSISDTCKAPPSLKNILKEVSSDIGTICYNMAHWTSQGVMLLNTILTVEDGKPLSHANKGWELLTDIIISTIVAQNKGCVFMLWGKQAQKKAVLINSEHSVLEAGHPSPLSAYKGFFGCKHFSRANEILGKERAIRWV
jgi:uracil-DNA glycosylase